MEELNQEGVKKALEISYRLDAGLMYLIQEMTDKSSAEIINLFYELANTVCEMGHKQKKNGSRGIRKNIIDFFPGTSIPFQMKVAGWKANGQWNSKTRAYENCDIFKCEVEVKFPEKRLFMKPDELEKINIAMMENALLDAGHQINVPPFKKPAIKANVMYKDVINAFMGREPEPKKSRKKNGADPSGNTSAPTT